MAAARSPCRCFKTRGLHFKVENIPLKDKNGKRKFKRMLSFLFVEIGKLFIKKSSFEEFNLVSSRWSLWSVLKCNQVSEVFAEFQVHFALYGQDNYVFEREFMYF